MVFSNNWRGKNWFTKSRKPFWRDNRWSIRFWPPLLDEERRAVYKCRARESYWHGRAHPRARRAAHCGRDSRCARKRAARGGFPAVENAECFDNSAYLRARFRSRPGDGKESMGHLSRKSSPLYSRGGYYQRGWYEPRILKIKPSDGRRVKTTNLPDISFGQVDFVNG